MCCNSSWADRSGSASCCRAVLRSSSSWWTVSSSASWARDNRPKSRLSLDDVYEGYIECFIIPE